VRWYVGKQHQHANGEWDLDFHIYGHNQVSAIPEEAGRPSEVLIIGEALASTQELAKSIAATARVATAVSPRILDINSANIQ
jgi:hypothetical protein